jgi:hypothetical protein
VTISWRELTRIEPGLEDLYEYAKSVRDDPGKPSFCANAVWYGYGPYRDIGIKRELIWLVGRNRPDIPELQTHEAYDLAYKKIYWALPGCRNCCCA